MEPYTRFHVDSSGGFAIERGQDMSEIIADNARIRNAGAAARSSDLRHVARVPVVAIEIAAKEAGVSVYEFLNNDQLLRRFLNDSNNAAFRVNHGLV